MNWCMALVELAQNKHPGVPTDLLMLSSDGKKLLCRDRREVLTALNTVASKRAHPSATRGANGTSRTDIIWPNLLRALYNRGVCFVPASRHSVEGAFIRKNNDAFVPPGKGWEHVDLESIFKSDRKKRRKKRERGDEEGVGPGEKVKRAMHRINTSQAAMSASAAAQALVSAAHSAQASSALSRQHAVSAGMSSSFLSSALAARIKQANAQAAAAQQSHATHQQQQQSALAASIGALQSLSHEALTQLVVQLQVRHRDAEMRELHLREAVVHLQQENASLRQQLIQRQAAAASEGMSAGRPRANSTLSTSSGAGAVASGNRIQRATGPIPPGPPTAGGTTPHGSLMPGLMSPAAAAAMNDSLLARGNRAGMTSHEAALMLMGGATPGGASHASGDGGNMDYSGGGPRARRGSYDMDELAADARAARDAMQASEEAAMSASDATGIHLTAPRLDGAGSVGPPTHGNGDNHSTVIGYTPRDRRRPSLLPADDDISEAADALHALSGGRTPAYAEDAARDSLAAAAASMHSQRRSRSDSQAFSRGRLRSRSEAERLM